MESLLIVLLALVSVTWFVPLAKSGGWRRAAVVVALLVLGAHLAIERDRWPMVPTYTLVGLLTLTTLWGSLRKRSTTAQKAVPTKLWRRLLCGCAWLLAVVVAAAVPTLFPHLHLPQPTGPYRIGVTDLFIVCRDRPETFTPAPDDFREIAARIWYPADPIAGSVPAAYMENAAEVSGALTRFTPFPSFLFAHLGRVRTHAYRGAPVLETDAPFPVVVFNHAYWGTLSQSTALMEELASHGYVAVSIGHAFETPYIVRDDGTVQSFDPHNAEFAKRGVERREAYDIERQLTMTRDTARLEELIRELMHQRPHAVESLHIWVADIRAVLDELERCNRGSGRFSGRLNLDRVGVMGHSFGGAATGQACLDDPRCKVGINFDGLQMGDALDRPLSVPFLFFHHDNAGAVNPTPNLPLFEHAEGPAYLAVIAGTGHLSYSDICLYPRTSIFRLAAPAGTISNQRCQTIVNQCVLAFLDHHLGERGTTDPAERFARFPEVDLHVRCPP
ncbi:MAG: hypothetical protein PVJ57_08800 [Phycisphaerae bacterium]|jgi:predicted dienelactone hydrolase